MTIKIVKPGIFSTIQDEGRIGYQHVGFSSAGAMDVYSYKLAKALIGNDGPAIEYTIAGPKIKFLAQNTFVLTGAKVNAQLNGKAIETQTVYYVKQNDVLDIGNATEGTRGYITFGQPLDIPKVAESYATHTRSGMGGFHGRALQKNDVISTLKQDAVKSRVGFSAQANLLPSDNTIRIIKGPQYDAFSAEAIERLTQSAYTISDQSDRMGYRLKGGNIAPETSADIISEPVALGSIQVPNDGNPIILLNDKQTVGGYTKIATVTALDISKLAQMKPGDEITFKWVTVDEAIAALDQYDDEFNKMINQLDQAPIFNLQTLRTTAKNLATVLKGEA